jgi:hypothetical protein
MSRRVPASHNCFAELLTSGQDVYVKTANTSVTRYSTQVEIPITGPDIPNFSLILFVLPWFLQ